MRDADIRAFLAELYEAGQQHDTHEQERSKRMLNLEPDTAQFLNILIRSTRTLPDRSWARTHRASHRRLTLWRQRVHRKERKVRCHPVSF
jgi:hypothetical protein